MGGDEALAPLTEAQAADLDRVVAELRIVLPDPTARDIHDYIEENMAASMGEWATANRVKKVNTRLNKAARAKAGVDRDMLEPDETDGPVVLEELGTWPDGTSLEEHLAEDEDTRIFSPDEHRAPVEGEDVAGGPSTALAYRRSLVACGGFWDGKLKVWRLHDDDDGAGAGAGAGGDPDELLVLCRAVRWWQSEKRGDEDGEIRAVFEVDFRRGNPRTGAHKRLVSALIAKHEEAGSVTCTREVRDVWCAHLLRNRYWDEKYGGGDGEGGDGSKETMLSSYVVTPAPEWFRRGEA